MTKPMHVLELNGRQYNALTGQLLHDKIHKSMDGVLPTHAPVQHGTWPDAVHHTAPSPTHTGIHRDSPHHAKPHQLQHSKTLMRQSVHRPDVSLKRQLHTVSHTGALAKAQHFDIVPKHVAANVDEARFKRAARIRRSNLVQRFAVPTSESYAPATYQPRATPAPITRVASPPQSTPKSETEDDVFARALAAAQVSRPAYTPSKHHKPKSHRLRHVTSIIVSSVAILLIVGFVAYQNMAMIQLHLASSHAGINATLPAWQPSGFTLGTLSSGPGTVTVSYHNSAGNNFSISQVASSWDSSTLLSDYVYPNNETYNTVSANGDTIYTYGNNNATWVNGGIWYKLTGGGSLTTSQIVNIATSM